MKTFTKIYIKLLKLFENSGRVRAARKLDLLGYHKEAETLLKGMK